MFNFNELKNPLYIEENRLPAYSDHQFFANFSELASGKSSFQLSLNGLWHFLYARNLENSPKDFWKMEFDCHNWETIRVPAHIQMEGYGEPHYTNTTYPWDGWEFVQSGDIPKRYNPVACYVKYFDVPENWDKIFISFQGVETAFALWLNGNFVGYSEDSFTPADFDLSPFINKKAENKLAVQVFRFSSSSWLEDQDFFRFSGIFREVFLYTKPKNHIEDIFIKALPINDYQDGSLNIEFKFNNTELKILDIAIYDKNNKAIFQESISTQNINYKFSSNLKNIILWSAENPYLYRIIFTLKDERGEILEIIPQNLGFREFKLENNLMKINGKRIVFKGVNRHEFDCYNGRAFSPELIEQDIISLKRNNINALRTSHYPNQSRLYELCDIYGLYVIDEANLETHGTWMKNGGNFRDENTIPNDNPQWLNAILDRAKSMLERDKNHPSILIWSCGNESSGGENLYKMSQYFREADPSRLVHYESIFWDRRFNDSSDMESQMYSPVERIKKFLKEHRDKPFICCEYTHAMGNSLGGMHKYTELSEQEELYQGGFIWDFSDQAIYSKEKNTLLYGGDFGDRPSDYNFSGNGIFFADRKATTKLQAVKFNYQNFSLIPSEDKLVIKNKSLFSNCEDFILRLSLSVEGREIWDKELVPPTISPNETKEIPLDLPNYGSGEYVITASLCLKNDELWAKKGYEIAFGQGIFNRDNSDADLNSWLFRKDGYFSTKNIYQSQQKFRVIKNDINLGVLGFGWSAMFSSAAGNIVSYKFNGKELLEEFPQPNFWRAPVDNDYGNNHHINSAQWKLASLYKSCTQIEFSLDNEDFIKVERFFGERGNGEFLANILKVRYTYKLPTNPVAYCQITYTVEPEGVIKTELDYKKVDGLADFPDFSIIFTLASEYDRIKFYGYGKLDNYSDRLAGAKLGIFESNTKAEMEPYLRPQECGNHCGIRWFALTDNRGRGIKIYSTTPFSASALPYNPQELENARHNYDLPHSQHNYLRASLAQAGVGGDDSWGAVILDEYLIKNEDKHFEFYFRGI